MNFQNIPRDDKVVKRAFVPREGNIFHFFDYKQIEPRLLAYFAAKKGDPTLAERIRAGLDPYTAILRSLYGENITEAQRQEGKILFLSLMYGGGRNTVMLQFNLSAKAARAMIDDFHKSLPIVRKLQDGVCSTARRRGYIRTPWGRHLHLEEHGEHKLLNKLIQGSAAHLMKRAMILVDDMLIRNPELDALGLSVVHDELILEAPHRSSEWLHDGVPDCMTTQAVGTADILEYVPIQVDHEVAVTSMADKRAYEEYAVIPY